MSDLQAARGLGWLSLAIAATEILGQGTVEQDLLGIDEHPLLLPALGVREAVAGVTLLSQHQITPTLAAGLWSRVAGDVMDLSLLAAAAGHTRKPSSFAGNALVVAIITALDVYYAARVQRRLMASRSDAAEQAALDDAVSSGTRPPRSLPAPV